MKTTITRIQMRFSDIDGFQHVNNVVLQEYFDLGKTDYFSEVLKVTDVTGNAGVITANTNLSYFAQTRYGEPLEVQTTVSEFGNKSLTLFQRLVNSLTGELKAESRSVMVAFDFPSQVSIPVPVEWKERAEDQ